MAAILKIKNHDISATVWLMFTKFGKMMQKRVPYLPQPLKYMNFKNIRLLNRNVQMILMKFGMETNLPPQKAHPFHESMSFEPSSMKICRRVWPVGKFPKKV